MLIIIAPTAFQRLAHIDGECATAKVAAEAGTLMVASMFSTHSLEANCKICQCATLATALYVP
jgi:isopentenyl diphosphate isomerase/L-lactate dehydrogenase-like FMN-dependent dehydrogenase